MFRRYIFSTDHKIIGLQYGFTSMFFLLVGFFLVMLIRQQQAYPGEVVPFVGGLLGETNAPGGSRSPEFYNQLGAMHGTIMVFLGVVPLAFGAFGNYIVPLQFGAPDMAFPRLNAGRQARDHLPLGKDVIHSFGLPQRRIKQDAIPGIVQPVWFTPTQTGEWNIACSQLCKLGHYRMRGMYAIQSQADFDAWLKEEAEYVTNP